MKNNFPISVYQYRFFLEWLRDPESTQYNCSFSFKFSADLKKEELKSACEKLLNRHEELRITFSREDQEAYLGSFSIDDCYHELDFYGGDINQEICALSERTFDLYAEPLIKFFLIEDKKSNDFYFLVCAHHAGFDAATMKVIKDEISLYYNDALSACVTECDLSPYQQAIESETIHIKDLDSNESRKYWNDLIQGQTKLDLNIPFNNNVKEEIRKRNNLHFTLTQEQINNLNRLKKLSRSTNFISISAIFGMVVSQLINEADFALSYPINMRPKGYSNICGCFVNTLPLVYKLESHDDLQTLAHKTKNQIKSSKRHYHFPLSEIVKDQRLARSDSGDNYFNFGVSESDLNLANMNLSGVTSTPIQRNTMSSYDLLLRFDIQSNGNNEFVLEYNAQQFEKELISSVSNAILNVLDAECIEHVQQQDIVFLAPNQMEAATCRYPISHFEGAKYQKLDTIFEANAKKFKDNISLTYENAEMSYGELNEKANDLAHKISRAYSVKSGVEFKKNTRVALYFERGFEAIISMLAVLKLGGTYVPLSTEYPSSRIDFILADSQCEVLLSTNNEFKRLDNLSRDILPVCFDEAELDLVSDAPPVDGSNGSESVAYVIYTSGTTGKPKGVPQSHQNVIRLFSASQEHFHFDENDTWLLYHNYIFDFSVWEIWGALLNGAKLVIPTSECTKDLYQIAKLCHRSGVSVLNQTPSVFYELSNIALSEKIEFANLRYVVFGGDRLNFSKLREWWNHYGDSQPQLVNMYGITETTVHVTYKALRMTDVIGVSNIGQPLPDVKCYVLNEHMKPVGIGMVGELYVGGAGLASEYIGRPELTKERFINNPFATEADVNNGCTRLYRSGDVVRRLSNGDMEYIGRNDLQVKVRGHRIELGEIEMSILELGGIDQVAVVQREVNNSKNLVAYFVCKGGVYGDSNGLETLRNDLERVLPDYMVPTFFKQIDVMPKTINGKLDKQHLPNIVIEAESEHLEAAKTELEKKLVKIWKKVLKIDSLGVNDNFFRVGGDSIVSIQLVSKIREEGIAVQVKDIFEAPTISSLAKRLDSTGAQIFDIDAEQGELEGVFELLPVQKWFFDKKFCCPNYYNQVFSIALPSEFSHSVLEEAINGLAARHDSLRCKFIQQGNQVTQRYESVEEFGYIQLQRLNAIDCDEHDLQEFVSTQQTSFDIENGPLWSVTQYSVSDSNKCQLIFCFHHLIMDSVSWRILFDDLKRVLLGKTLPNKTTSYRAWVNEVYQYEVSEQEAEFWHSQTIGTNGRYSHTESKRVDEFVLTEENTQNLLHKSNIAFDTEINDLLLSAFAMAMAATFGTQSHSITLEGHGREPFSSKVDLSSTVGWFTTMYPVTLEAKHSTAETIVHTKELLRKVPNKGLGFGVMSALGQIGTTLPPIRFNYLGTLDSNDDDQWNLQASKYQNRCEHNDEGIEVNIIAYTCNKVMYFKVESYLSEFLAKTFSFSLLNNVNEVISVCLKNKKEDHVKNIIEDDFQPYVYLKENHKSSPVILMPISNQGYEIYLNTLLPHVPEESNVIAFDLNRNSEFMSFEEHSNYIVDIILNSGMIRDNQCSILGWSYGAILSHMVAAKLDKAGVKVLNSYLIDPLLLDRLGVKDFSSKKQKSLYSGLSVGKSRVRTHIFKCAISDPEVKDKSVRSACEFAINSKYLMFEDELENKKVINIPCAHYEVFGNKHVMELISDIVWPSVMSSGVKSSCAVLESI
ncbi:amino acid adenylation domain-containing protein [Vibrio sp. S4M6]|uniref:non-ribosomal peptide synthetase n=1 Tax=Vibrio sinus TaxID=2946865 RepID=UPI002029D165|nr:non-ribosomal peptide synthetase [Vibrio sinus]MCL9782399.1 amino acid adenylation domain-containing protein [Vibrio sinus]